ncbi:MAG: hypothetical protein WCX46_04340 [Candidatus Paceibacterota bacterium]
MKEKFFAFLKKHKAYKKWLKCFLRDKNDIKFFLCDDNIRSFLSGAFTWATANELNEYNQKDHNSWSHLNQLWLKELEKDPS